MAASDLTHGFRVAFDVLLGLTLLAALVTVCFIEPVARAQAEVEPVAVNSNELIEEAA